MSLATLADVLQPAMKSGYAVGGLVCLGWEDARAYAFAAEAENVPVILQAGPSCREHTPLPVLASMFRHLAEQVDVPVVAHLDHGYTKAECVEAIECGFTSIMFDGSKLSLEENVAATGEICALAHDAGVSCEGEIGFVGYSGGVASKRTDAQEAAKFARETGVDAMAISVGNVHLQENKEGGLNEAAISAIDAVTDVPLVIHGGSGVPPAQRSRLARETSICKFNIGTELRMEFGKSLRGVLAQDQKLFDRVQILKQLEPDLVSAARRVLAGLQ